jgi:hypothetical protein
MTPVRQRMTEDMQVRNLSPHTQTLYVQQVSLFARYFGKSPELLGPEEIRAYQIYLTNEKKLATSSILIAVSALRFLYASSGESVGGFASFSAAKGRGNGEVSGRWNRRSAVVTLPIPEHRRGVHPHRRSGRKESARYFSFSEKGFR